MKNKYMNVPPRLWNLLVIILNTKAEELWCMALS